jgi:hypothetical protein
MRFIQIKGENKDFMEDYQNSMTPASLSLYFYIAYQFIQEIPNESEDDKKEVTKLGLPIPNKNVHPWFTISTMCTRVVSYCDLIFTFQLLI